MPKVVEDEVVITKTEQEGKDALEAEGTFGASWRIMLFRGVRDNDIELVKRVCSSHPAAIHEHFTSGMKEWELQWDSLRWYEFGDSTALYIASAYCSDKVVRWLLANGVDPDAVCYSKQTAQDVIGVCTFKQEQAKTIDDLLKADRLPPQPPIKPTLFAKIGYEDHLKTVYEEVMNPEDPDGPKMKRAKRVSETVVRCKVSVTYKSYWLPPKTQYEVRIRAMKSPEWRTERTQATHKMITGLAAGTTYELLSEDISDFFETTYKYLADQVVGSLPNKLGLPSWFLEMAVEKGLEGALDWTYNATFDYVDPAFWDELRGVSDGSGTSYDLLRRIHMLPEATKGHCSMFGASDSATKSGNLLQLRALDWDVDGPFKDNVNVVVYHNDDGSDRVSWANIAWSGFIGSVTGFNSQQLGISEIGVTYPDESFGKESRHGIPFVNLLRDILEKDSHFEDANKRISEATRTCNLILGVGDAKTGEFNSVQYSNSVANFITSDNLQPVNETWHAPIEDVVYFGMDWLCPNYSEVLHDRVSHHRG
ncbi:hypothetical protein TrRE_jg2056 [Triparma retinervis]|uniref:Uncharacterized protein n=1 Tax=Triparma retinervis TaxID=2557542 RepID=A0A9W7AYZ9_9STRA|nr:hypothetical protein TrRE_jg2056 [Triparma retinervis]